MKNLAILVVTSMVGLTSSAVIPSAPSTRAEVPALYTGTVLFSDSFDDNAKGWDIRTSGMQRSYLSNGSYVMELLENSAGFQSAQNLTIPSDSDFLMETTARAVSGQDYFYGLFWESDWKNTFVFSLSPAGVFSVHRNRGRLENSVRHVEIESLIERTRSPYIKGGDAYNRMTVIRSGGALKFLINGELAGEVPSAGIAVNRAGLQIGGLLKVEFEEYAVRTEKPGPPAVIIPPDSTGILGPAGRPSGPPFAVQGTIVDFIDRAPAAVWSSAYLKLSFPGTASDSNGSALLLQNVPLEDGKVHAGALQVHPAWKPNGIIAGRYPNITIPAAGAEFRARIGLTGDASASDGVYFEIWAEFPGFNGIPLRREYFKPYSTFLVDFTQDLTRFAGMTGTVALVVNAGEKSSDQDRAVWVQPKLFTSGSQGKTPQFVGGAVGSGRSGDQLLNPWGGKTGILHGNVTLYLLFSDLDSSFDVRLETFHEGRWVGDTKLGSVSPGNAVLWSTLTRTATGRWRERVILGNLYLGDLRYTISQM